MNNIVHRWIAAYLSLLTESGVSIVDFSRVFSNSGIRRGSGQTLSFVQDGVNYSLVRQDILAKVL